jgi:DNA-binding MarR family transcriptional regulator
MSSIMPKPVDHVNHKGDAGDVLEAVHRVMHLFRSLRHRAAAGDEPGPTHMEGKALGFFARHPGATLSELVAHAGRDKGQLARLVAALRERGLLEARVDACDRRNQHLHLTGAGADAHHALQREGRKIAQAAVRGLSEAERLHLLELLRRVESNLEGLGDR